MHTCPMATPGLPPVPHVGGPITGPGVPTVLIGGMPAAVMGDVCTCVGPPDTIVLGSMGVLIGGKPAARMGDQCVHGGMVSVGCTTVLIGEGAGGPLPKQVINSLPANVKPKAAQTAAFKDASKKGDPFVHNCSGCPKCSPPPQK